MKKILISVFSIAVVGLVAFGATQAFFSDTEISTGNILKAGALDLKIDNTCYYNGQACVRGFWQGNVGIGNTGNVGIGNTDPTNACSCTWQSKDLVRGDVFFNLHDLKPGDWEEDTISIDVDNPSWLCADIKVTRDADNSCTEPEQAAVGGENGACVATEGKGELAKNLHFVFWTDDGDNVWECDRERQTCEEILTEGTADKVLGNVRWALADSKHGRGPIGPQRYYIGKFFCFGRIGEAPELPGNGGPVGGRGSGFTCDGRPVDNQSQTDSLEGDISFYAEQARHNDKFLCNPLPTPTPTPT